MAHKAVRFILILFAAGALSATMFAGGLALGLSLPGPEHTPLELFEGLLPGTALPASGSSATAGSSQDGSLEELFKPFWQAWEIIHQRYVDQPVDDQALMHGAIRGMLDALGDQHTAFMDPDQYNQASIDLAGEYEGIGAWVDTESEYLTIISPMPGSPAERAGLKSGDQVLFIDGEDMTGIDGLLVIRRVLGPAGTVVHLSIRRAGESELLEIDVERESITVPSVESRMLDDQIGYVRLFTFGQSTTRDLRQALNALHDQGAEALVLDLRGNGGGFLTTAIEVASEFIGEGVIMIERFGDGREEVYTARRGGLATDLPLAVLINAGSASASEIVAGAIQDHGRGVLVGEASFGKGSVQDWIPLDEGHGAVRVTIARWYTPNGRLIHEVGVEPDLTIELTEEDLLAEIDRQLDAAIEALRSILQGEQTP
jgi:carboxyl-terminal processing protease